MTFYSDAGDDVEEYAMYSETGFDPNVSIGETVSVPFREEGGVKFIPVSVNGVAFDMILDSGCSTALITVAEANYLYNKGRLTENDVLGASKSTIADGSIVENMVINLRQVVIGGKILCTDVQASVVENAHAPLLLGNDVLDRVASYSINNQTKTIDFILK